MSHRTTRSIHQRSPSGDWEWVAAAPSQALRGLVRDYSGWVERSERPLRRRELPTSTPVLILNLGAPKLRGAP